MTTIASLKKSISEMTKDELNERLRVIRTARGVPTTRVTKSSLSNMMKSVDKMGPEELTELAERLSND